MSLNLLKQTTPCMSGVVRKTAKQRMMRRQQAWKIYKTQSQAGQCCTKQCKTRSEHKDVGTKSKLHVRHVAQEQCSRMQYTKRWESKSLAYSTKTLQQNAMHKARHKSIAAECNAQEVKTRTATPRARIHAVVYNLNTTKNTEQSTLRAFLCHGHGEMRDA